MDLPEVPESLEPSAIGFLAKPETRLLMKLVGAFVDYAIETVLPEATFGNMDFQELTEALRGKAPHPEAREPIWTSIDERQEGRSEVIREISNPKQS